MNKISKRFANNLIDFSGGNAEFKGMASQQLEGSVALFNFLTDKNMAYLADEVGMGKTYVALGVVALMRYFNPTLKVLYLSPKNNVRSKWIKDYKSFISKNYQINDLRVKSLDGLPATPYIECSNLESLINSCATGNYSDFHITTSAMSFGLSDDNEEYEFTKELQKLKSFLPSYADKIPASLKNKSEVKNYWAQVINQLLPTFDLVIVDEAHNLKNGIDGTSRNKVLAQILGTPIPRQESMLPGIKLKKRVSKLLLLSATPFDRNIKQLRNQLEVFGYKDQLSSIYENSTNDERNAVLETFMVRRLNELSIQGKPHTRNMYRREHREGEFAEVNMSETQKLFSALVQKKVMHHLRKGFGGKYQTGMLASFETYLPGTGKQQGTDSDESNPSKEDDARDINVITKLIDSYKTRFKELPPHPKMDWIVSQKSKEAFEFSRKQLLFVRRIKSVTDLREKFDEKYDEWLYQKLKKDLGASHWILLVFDKYRKEVNRSQETISEYLSDDGELISQSSSNFFRWFYTGSVSDSFLGLNKKHAVDSFKVNLTKKENKSGFLFEFNWYKALSDVQPLYALEDIYKNLPKGKKTEKQSYYDDYLSCQLAFITLLKDDEPGKYDYLYDYYSSNLDLNRVSSSLSFSEFSELIQSPTFFSELDNSDVLSGKLFKKLSKLHTTSLNKAIIHKLEFHRELLFSLCRLDHSFIDLYTSFLESKSIDSKLIQNFIINISNQIRLTELSSYRILKDLNENIELILKLNFEDYTNKTKSEFRGYINWQLGKISPVAGASGSGIDKTSIARRFRMPGYPMILVSTNVLQEGEDLHTFCDSVSHYGLSASPIAIEQKNGRVDRINSLSHRKLTKCEGYQSSDLEKEFIQVFFPHVKESIEYGQMISFSSNMNDYILSLNEINTDKVTQVGDVSIDDIESFRQGIKPPITTHLKRRLSQ